jgi:uncharacterized protein with WD repeat
VQHIQWSPLGNFMVTWERKSDVRENLFVWNGNTGEEVLRLYYRDFEPDLWPLLQWSNDEEIMVHQIGDNLHVLNGHTLARYTCIDIHYQSFDDCDANVSCMSCIVIHHYLS